MAKRFRGIGLRRKQAAERSGMIAGEVAAAMGEQLGYPVEKHRIYDFWQGAAMEEQLLVAYARATKSTVQELQIPVPEEEWAALLTPKGNRFSPSYRRDPNRPPAPRSSVKSRGGMPDEQLRRIVAAIRERSERQGILVKALAAQMNPPVHPHTMGKWLMAKPPPPLDRLPELAAAVGTTLPELTQGTPPARPEGASVGRNAPLTQLGLSVGTEHLLSRAGMAAVGDLTRFTPKALVERAHLTERQRDEVSERLAAAGYPLAGDAASEAERVEEPGRAEEPERAAPPVAEYVQEAGHGPGFGEEGEKTEELETLAVPALTEREIVTIDVGRVFPPELELVPAAVEPFTGTLFGETEELVLILSESLGATDPGIESLGQSLLQWLAFASHTGSADSMAAAVTKAHQAVLSLGVALRLLVKRQKVPAFLGARLLREFATLAERLKQLELDSAAALEEGLQ